MGLLFMNYCMKKYFHILLLVYWNVNYETIIRTTKAATVEMIVFQFQKTRKISIQKEAIPGEEGLPKYFLILLR